MEVNLTFPTKDPEKVTLMQFVQASRWIGRFPCKSENTLICEKHFRKHEIIKGFGGVRCRLSKGMALFRSL